MINKHMFSFEFSNCYVRSSPLIDNIDIVHTLILFQFQMLQKCEFYEIQSMLEKINHT